MEVFYSQDDTTIADLEQGESNVAVNVEPNLVPYISDNKVGFADSETQEVIIPCKYDYAYNFIEGLALVELNEKKGFIDNLRNEVIPCRYDYAWWFREGLAQVVLDEKYGFIDKAGNEVVPCKYTDTKYFSKGLIPVELNKKWGFIDKMGAKLFLADMIQL